MYVICMQKKEIRSLYPPIPANLGCTGTDLGQVQNVQPVPAPAPVTTRTRDMRWLTNP
jgi:hypothetical protein